MPELKFESQFFSGDGKAIPKEISLLRFGPIVQCTVSLTDNALLGYSDGRVAPRPIKGFAMIDTGATFTAIDTNTAANGGIPQVSFAKTSTASDKNLLVPTFDAKIVCHCGQSAQTISFSSSNIIGVNLTDIIGKFREADTDFILLLGRDFLKHTVLVYDGGKGSFSLTI